MTEKLSGPMLAPKDGAVEQIIVLLHGYGSDGNDLIALGGQWRPLFPHALIVSPNGSEPCAEAPMGRQWFALDPARMKFDLAAVERASATVNQMLADLWAQTGLGPEKTVLGGFSQGAMLALHTGLRQTIRLGGILAFSGRIIAPERLETELASKPEVCLAHGEADPVVPVSGSHKALRLLENRGVPVRLHTSPGQGHTITPDGLEFATVFLKETLGS